MVTSSFVARSLALLALAAAVGCATESAPRGPTSASTMGAGSTGAGDVSKGGSKLSPPAVEELASVASGLGDGTLRARLTTSEGAIECVLFEEEAPRTVANFVGLARGLRPWMDPDSETVVERPFFDGLVFHRVIPGFAIQSGDPTATGNGGPGYVFDDEFSAELRHDSAGVMSMANHGPNTNGSQFFITEGPAPHLDFRHTVFGKCSNPDVVTAIARAPTGPDDVPEEPPVLERVEIYRGDAP